MRVAARISLFPSEIVFKEAFERRQPHTRRDLEVFSHDGVEERLRHRLDKGALMELTYEAGVDRIRGVRLRRAGGCTNGRSDWFFQGWITCPWLGSFGGLGGRALPSRVQRVKKAAAFRNP